VTSADRDSALSRFEQLYHATRTDLLGFLLRRTKDPEVAADLLAETYLVAWRKPEAVPAGEDARPWLFGVARNLMLKDFRRQRVAGAMVQRLAEEVGALQVSHSAVDDQRTDTLAAAMAGLSQLDREIVTLNAWEGLTPREIAVVLGTSANVVRVRLHRTRARLRREVAELCTPTQSDLVAITTNH
jgi:RNA polymerase sigma-70 factor (ECF subfamily)